MKPYTPTDSMTSPKLLFVFTLLAYTLVASPTVAETFSSSARSTTEPVLIRKLLDEATSYQAHNIAVIGIVKDIEKWPPMSCGQRQRGIRYDSYVLIVEDESGSIRVEAMGTCGVQGVVEPVRVGDRVLVEGICIQLLSGDLRSLTPFIFTAGMAIRRLPQ
jgi:hypothetical protein